MFYVLHLESMNLLPVVMLLQTASCIGLNDQTYEFD